MAHLVAVGLNVALIFGLMALGWTQTTGDCCVMGPAVNVAAPAYWVLVTWWIGLGYWFGRRDGRSKP